MKALRKSLTKDQYHAQISPPLPPISRPSPTITPPQKVIRATSPYRSSVPTELSFQKGDFFHVIREVNDRGGAWYEAHNPITGARGLVPRALFDEFNKGAAPARTSQAMTSPITRTPSVSLRTQAFFAIVMHDFTAERTDELDAKAGDAITVVAQSNREWFVAKPIGRLGKPGLIPVSFVQVRDPMTNQAITDVDGLINNGTLPSVEEWKKQVMSYKASSIPLGTLDETGSAGVPNSPFPYSPIQSAPRSQAPLPSEPDYPGVDGDGGGGDTRYQEPHQPPPRSVSLPAANTALLPDGLLLSARVTAFHYENDDYWFRVQAVYQPFDDAGSTTLPPARDLTLFRAYNDFFDFQTTLLQVFPAEAGQTSPAQARVIPYMPGPSERVDDTLSARRCEELDGYVVRLTALSRTTARYVLEHPHVREFFSARPGDLDRSAGPQFEAMSEAGWFDPTDSPETQYPNVDGRASAMAGSSHDYNVDEYADDARLSERFENSMRVGNAGRDSGGSDYGDEPHTNGYHANGLSNNNAHGYPNRTPSPRGHAESSSMSRPMGASSHGQVHGSNNGYSNGNGYGNGNVYGRGSDSSGSASSSSRWPEHRSQSTHATSPGSSPVRYSASSTSPGSKPPSDTSSSHSGTATSGRSGGTATAPPRSASNPAPAFVKIKVFDRRQDDVIALRVHPRVPLAELREKVGRRLAASESANGDRDDTLTGRGAPPAGRPVRRLAYRKPGTDALVVLNADEELLAWIEGAERHVLYAE